MPTDHLATDADPDAHAIAPADIDALEQAVLHNLAGTLTDPATTIEPVDLPGAVAAYQRAGRQALTDLPGRRSWRQVYIEFTNWAAADRVAADHLVPLLSIVEERNALAGWWFMRKHPCWRLRFLPGAAPHDLDTTIHIGLDNLVATGKIRRWWFGIYEAETAAFGGGTGIAVAHDLFVEDSPAVLRSTGSGNATGGLGQRELSITLCTVLMRAAGLEWYEQADVWHRVTLERPLPNDIPSTRINTMTGDMRQLLRTDTTPDGPLLSQNGPLALQAAWVEAYRLAGHRLGDAARNGHLDRGLRHILSYHVIFAWNRHGLPARTQAVLARAARAAILDLPDTPAHPPAAHSRVTARTPDRADAPSSAPTNERKAPARFPLIHAASFHCADLATRVRDVHHFATTARQADTAEERISRACAAWNLAALIASDCAMPDLAADLCQRQFALFHTAWPLSGRIAIAALQPLVNLVRLQARADHPDSAFTALTDLHRAVHHGGSATIGDLDISFDQFTRNVSDRAEVSPWLRVVLREDGTRLLASAAQWSRAAAHAAQFDDAPEQLCEARQTLAISYALDDRTDHALAVINNSTTYGLEDRAIAAILCNWVCLTANRQTRVDGRTILHTAYAAIADPSRPATARRAETMFRIRLGLAALDVAASAERITATTASTKPAELLDELARQAEQSGDALTARELLRHPASRRLNANSCANLHDLVAAASLGRPAALTSHLSDLTTILASAGSAIIDALNEEHR